MYKRLPGFDPFLRSWLSPAGMDHGATTGHVGRALVKMLFLFVIVLIAASAHAQDVGMQWAMQ